MVRCTQCNRWISAAESAAGAAQVCAECAAAPPSDWVSIARVTNLAELGYFEEMLARADFDLRVTERDHFEASIDTWQRVFVLQVPQDQAARAVELVQSEVADSAPDEEAEEPTIGTGWKVMGMVAAVIIVGYWLLPEGPVPGQRLPRNVSGDLWRSLLETDGQIGGEHKAGELYRELRVDARHDRAVLLDDFNGDGHFDRRREFSHNHLVTDQRI